MKVFTVLVAFALVLAGTAASQQVVTAIASGGEHSLALKSDGTVWAWGDNSYGQLGQGTFPLSCSLFGGGPTCGIATPVQVLGPAGQGSTLQNIVAIATSGSHSLALKSDGTVWAWGSNNYGQLGQGIFTTSTPYGIATPVQVLGPAGQGSMLQNIVTITVGSLHSLALKSDGTVWAWGNYEYGQLGQGTFNTNYPYGIATPVQVLDPSGQSSGLQGVVALAAGGYHSLALKFDGTVWAWGYNGNGQLGNGMFTTISPYFIAIPVQVLGPSGQGSMLQGIVAVAAGSFHSLALKSDGTVWAWGDNGYGQLGQGTFTTTSPYGIATPVQVTSLSGVFSIAATGLHSLNIRSDGMVWAWGNDFSGQLGQGTFTASAPYGIATPVQVLGPTGQGSALQEIVEVAAGGVHSLALKSDGTVWAWGRNLKGQLGQGTFTTTSPYGIATPVQVLMPGITPQPAARVSIKRILDGSGSSPWTSSQATVLDWVQRASLMLSHASVSLTLSEFVSIPDPASWYAAPVNGLTRNDMETAAEATPCPYVWRYNAINIYLTNGQPGANGAICSLPSSASTGNDIVIIGSGYAAEDIPRIIAHELGHYFGLLHTFHIFGVEGSGTCFTPASNCNAAGDQVCDTPRDPFQTTFPAPEAPLVNLYGTNSCQYARLRWNVMSYYPGINATNAVLTPGQRARAALFRPYRTNVFVGGNTLISGCVFSQGVPSPITLFAPSAPNAAYITLPALSQPLNIGSGIPTAGGGAFLLPPADPVLQLAISPAGPSVASGITGFTDPSGAATTTVNLPTTPSLTGITLYWQSVVIGPAGFLASQVLPVTFQ